jgi:uncharacterized damage-inducible protein DinB
MDTRGDEESLLVGFLEQQREALRRKAGDLGSEALRRTLPPTAMTLGGMVKHLAYVESWWFGQVLAGEQPPEAFAGVDWRVDRDWDWRSAFDDSPETLWGLYDEMVARSRAIVRDALDRHGLESVAQGRRGHAGADLSLRWILLHMITEYARHLGHADLLRESIDGRTGL